MTLEEHAKNLGGLLANFQSLEFCLRAFLQSLPTARPFGLPRGTDIYSFPTGVEVPENEFTSYDSLSKLISKYNREMQARGGQPIDSTLVDVRDALAHGRVSAASADGTLRLLKFSKPQNERVRITFNETMSAAWFQDQNRRVASAMRAVHHNCKS